jgi:hypothetical protein
VGSLTDRVLPHLLPTPDRDAFAGVLRKALGIGRPLPSAESPQATWLGAVDALASPSWFSSRAKQRLVIVLTDGESAPFDAETVRFRLAAAHVRVILVVVSRPGEGVYRANGTREPGYRPAPSPPGDLRRFASVFGESDREDIVRVARASLGTGRTEPVARPERTVSLAPYAALAAGLPLLGLFWARR